MTRLHNSALEGSLNGDSVTSSQLQRNSDFLNSTPDKVGPPKEDFDSTDEGFIGSLDISAISPVSRQDCLVSNLSSPSLANSVHDELD